MRIRLRGPLGASTITLNDDATVGDLRASIAEKTALAEFDIKHGYPPKPLQLGKNTDILSSLHVHLDGEQLTISVCNMPSNLEKDGINDISARKETLQETSGAELNVHNRRLESQSSSVVSFTGMPGTKISSYSDASRETLARPVALKRKEIEMEVPELPLPDRGATIVLRVMPDDNSCLFRAFGTAVLPGDDLSMTELRSVVATAIQERPDVYTQVVLEQKPDDYCRWIQTEDAWGGAIELSILSQHFDIEVCSIDVQSLRIDRFNEGRPTRCILVYSGIHYDTIVQSPSEPPHTKAGSPEFDQRLWDADDSEIMAKAQELCKRLQAQHYFTDTGGMTIKCNECGWVGYGEGQASLHAQQRNHYDMAETKQNPG